MTWGKYKGAEDDIEIQGPNHDYGKWFSFNNPISKPETIRHASDKIETTIHLYTDGSSKGAMQTKDRKCFSGWGCNMQIEGPDGNRHLQFSGGLYNADPHTAELSAVYQALIRIKEPCKIHIHSDSQYVITALKNLPDFIAKRTKAIELIAPSQRSILEKIELKRLELWQRVQRELNKPMIKGITIQWIKSHQLDDSALNKEDLSYDELRDIKGNDVADKLSNIGVISGIVTALEKLAELHATDDKSYEWSSAIIKKNLSASAFCKEVAVMYLVEKPNLLTQDIMDNILDTYSRKRISSAIRDGIHVTPVHQALVQTITTAKEFNERRSITHSGEPSCTTP